MALPCAGGGKALVVAPPDVGMAKSPVVTDVEGGWSVRRQLPGLWVFSG